MFKIPLELSLTHLFGWKTLQMNQLSLTEHKVQNVNVITIHKPSLQVSYILQFSLEHSSVILHHLTGM